MVAGGALDNVPLGGAELGERTVGSSGLAEMAGRLVGIGGRVLERGFDGDHGGLGLEYPIRRRLGVGFD